MGNNGSDEVMIPRVDEAGCSETTVEIKIKTLDSQTYTLRVNKCVPVPELKEQIETVTGVLSDQQRLICRGKVLKDDQLLSAYHVEDGHTLHLVVRQPIPPSSASTTGSMGSDSMPNHQASDPASSTGPNRGNPVAHSVVLGTFNVADQGDGGIPDLNRILSAVFSSIGIPNIGNSSEGVVNLREAGLNRLETVGPSGMSDSTWQQPDIRTTRVQYDPLHGAFRLPTEASSEPLQPLVIPDSLATLSQYLIYLKREFSANGGGQAVDAGMQGNEEQNYNAALGSDGAQGGLPTPASLVEVMLSTRQMLIQQAGECLFQLARQLEGQANVSTPSLRNGIQTSAMRSGVLLQNLGALLLELGRTTMTLRMGQSPSDAVVNAGPAVFISTSGPNPIMVQPLPFQPGMGFGASATNHTGNPSLGSGLMGGSLGSGFIPRNIDIRIRTGPSMSTATVNQGEQSGTEQTSGQTGPERVSSNQNFVHRVAAGLAGGQSFAREAEVRMLPVRTVVAAVPAAVSRPTSDSSGNSVGLFYPLLARVQQVTPGQINNSRSSQSSDVRNNSIPEVDRHWIPDSTMQQQQNAESNTEAPVTGGVSETLNLFPTIAASAVSLVTPSNTVSQHHQQGSPIPNSIRQEPPNSNNNNSIGCESQNVEESVMQLLGRSEQLPSAIFPREHMRVGDSDCQVLATESTIAQGGTARDTERQEEAPRIGIDEGIFLSRLIRQILPYISHISATEPSPASQETLDISEQGITLDSSRQTQENSVGVGTSHQCSEPPPSPRSPKRQKRE